jgi:MerR family transcriptional regulator, redox-sensitive transcriptional activator SoxR
MARPLPADLGIGEIARRTGLPLSTLRFYEAKGLVRPIRSDGGQRRYRRADIRRISFVMIAADLGFTLAEIRGVLAGLPEGRAPNARDWTRISTAFRTELDRRIAVMQRLRARLDGCIGCGCLSLKTCRLLNPDDEAADGGPGPSLMRE